MAKRKNRRLDPYKLLILGILLFFFTPLLLFSEIITAIDNDLGRTYIPIFQFIRDSFYQYKSLPLWRPDQMMGEPFIGIGLSPLVYPVNILFLIFKVRIASILFYFIHFLIASYSTYFLAKSFSFNKLSSFATAIFYAFSIKMLMHMSAGHITMVAAFSYLPLIFLATRRLLIKESFYPLIYGAISLSAMLILYPTVFYYSSIFIFIYVLYFLWQKSIYKNFKLIRNKIFFIGLLFVIAIGLSAIQLIPQIEFSFFSNRADIKLDDAALPLWNLRKFLSSLIMPYMNFSDLDHESLLYMGVIPSLLSLFGLFILTYPKKIFVSILGITSLIFIAGISTPLFPLAFKYFPLLSYSRISTRPWFVIVLIVSLLAGFALNKIRNKHIIFIMIAIFLIEVLFVSYRTNVNISVLPSSNNGIYEYLANNNDLFRVYCTTYCFNPQLIQKYNINVLHGETPISDRNTTDFLQKAGNYNFDDFAVIFPPYQIWQVEDPPVPNAELLGRANVKFIASTYELLTKDFRFIEKYEDIFLYENLKYKPRFYFSEGRSDIAVIKYSPNEIILKFQPNAEDRQLILSEKYYPGWFAFMNNKKHIVHEYDSLFRLVTIPPNTNTIRFSYNPISFKLGRTITFLTLILIIIYYFRFHKKPK